MHLLVGAHFFVKFSNHKKVLTATDTVISTINNVKNTAKNLQM